MTTNTNGSSDLTYAPPGFKDCVFADFISAHYHIVFDLSGKKHASVTSTIRFKTEQPGKPLFDMAIDPRYIEAWLVGPNSRTEIDCKTVFPDLMLDPGSDVELQCLDKLLEPGEYTVEIRHRLDKMPVKPRHIKWGKKRVRCALHMSDVRLPGRRRRFLDHYLPSNLEFDQFKITMQVEVRSTRVPHVLITNLGIQKGEDNVWEFAYPDHFTTSFPWFHLVPRDEIVTRTILYGRIAGLVYARVGSSAADQLRFFDQQIVDTLRALEWGISRFPYDYLTVFATDLSSGGGMEYAGAAFSTLQTLRHELDHSYYARCIAPVNGNAGWIDEAIASWGDFNYFQLDAPPQIDVADRHRPGLAAHSPYRRVTDHRAYTLGRDFLAHLDHLFVHEAGISGGMRAFLRHYFATFRTKQVRSVDFENSILDYHRTKARHRHKTDLRDYFQRYVNRMPADAIAATGAADEASDLPRQCASSHCRHFYSHEISAGDFEKALLG